MKNYSFKKQNRLLSKEQYKHVFLKPNRDVSSLFCVLFKKNNLSKARLGLAISKKVIFKAHDRNRVKRIIRETFRKKAGQLAGSDIVFTLTKKSKLENYTRDRILLCLEQHWQKLMD